jgi:hypothetical protein
MQKKRGKNIVNYYSGEFFLGFLLTIFFTIAQKSNNINTSTEEQRLNETASGG